jgi:hypothetical protein
VAEADEQQRRREAADPRDAELDLDEPAMQVALDRLRQSRVEPHRR